MFEALGAIIFRFRWVVLIASAAFLAIAGVVLSRGGDLTTGDIHGLEAESAQWQVDAVTGRPADTTVVVMFAARDGIVLQAPALAEAIGAALAPLRGDPRIASVL